MINKKFIRKKEQTKQKTEDNETRRNLNKIQSKRQKKEDVGET